MDTKIIAYGQHDDSTPDNLLTFRVYDEAGTLLKILGTVTTPNTGVTGMSIINHPTVSGNYQLTVDSVDLAITAGDKIRITARDDDSTPQEAGLLIAPKLFGVEYDYNGSERADTTTIGAINHNTE